MHLYKKTMVFSKQETKNLPKAFFFKFSSLFLSSLDRRWQIVCTAAKLTLHGRCIAQISLLIIPTHLSCRPPVESVFSLFHDIRLHNQSAPFKKPGSDICKMLLNITEDNSAWWLATRQGCLANVVPCPNRRPWTGKKKIWLVHLKLTDRKFVPSPPSLASPLQILE